jgi:hypothetical protein
MQFFSYWGMYKGFVQSSGYWGHEEQVRIATIQF